MALSCSEVPTARRCRCPKCQGKRVQQREQRRMWSDARRLGWVGNHAALAQKRKFILNFNKIRVSLHCLKLSRGNDRRFLISIIGADNESCPLFYTPHHTKKRPILADRPFYHEKRVSTMSDDNQKPKNHNEYQQCHSEVWRLIDA